MIHEVLQAIVDELNAYLKLRFDLSDKKVVLSNLVAQDGGIAIKDENRLICSLVHIEPERMQGAAKKYIKQESGGFSKLNPPINFNIYALFAAHFSQENYTEALKFVSTVISFFQRKPVFTKNNTSGLSTILNVEKLTAEMVSLDLKEQSNIWATMGAKYLPSVLFRLRTLSIQELEIGDATPVIKGIE